MAIIHLIHPRAKQKLTEWHWSLTSPLLDVMSILLFLVPNLRGKVHIDADLKNKKATVDAKPPKE